MVARLLSHTIERFDAMTVEMIDSLPGTGRMEALLETLFDEDDTSSENASVFQA